MTRRPAVTAIPPWACHQQLDHIHRKLFGHIWNLFDQCLQLKPGDALHSRDCAKSTDRKDRTW